MIPGHPIFEEFLAEHPHFADREHVRVLPGAQELRIPTEVLGAFLTWCVLQGYVGPQEMTSFLADVAPHLRTVSDDDQS